jgi:two-component system LytT family response regulator
MRTLIVDDEPVARSILREELGQHETIDLIGEAASGSEALKLIEAMRPDLVFLDLQMPGMSGFDIVKRVGGCGKIPVFVIVTAYDQYAIKAFEAGAVDYLLKPVRQERIAEAIGKAGRMLARVGGAAQQLAALTDVANADAPKPIRRIVARSGPEYLLLGTDEVLAFQAEGDLVWIVTAKKRFLATEPLRKIQEKLESNGFRRIHRNALVNLDHIRKMSPLTSNRWLLTMSNNLEFIVSKRQARNVQGLLSW